MNLVCKSLVSATLVTLFIANPASAQDTQETRDQIAKIEQQIATLRAELELLTSVQDAEPVPAPDPLDPSEPSGLAEPYPGSEPASDNEAAGNAEPSPAPAPAANPPMAQAVPPTEYLMPQPLAPIPDPPLYGQLAPMAYQSSPICDYVPYGHLDYVPATYLYDVYHAPYRATYGGVGINIGVGGFGFPFYGGFHGRGHRPGHFGRFGRYGW